MTTKPRISGGTKALRLVNLGIQGAHIQIQNSLRFGVFNLYSPERQKQQKINTAQQTKSALFGALFAGQTDKIKKMLGKII